MPRKQQNQLTDRKIRSLIAAGGPKAISDGAGLTLTISSTGYTAWVLRYRFGGKRQEVSIGSFADISLERARKRRDDLRELLGEGIDPARHKRSQQVAAAQSHTRPDTFAELATVWLDKTQRRKLEHPEKVEQALNNHILPRIGDMAPTDIKPIHIIDCIHAIIEAGAPTLANKCRVYIRRIFDYGILIGEIDINPAAQITQAVAGYRESPRNRALSLTEIRKFCRTMEEERNRIGRDNEIAALLLLMLGVRKSELAKARWDEFDLEGEKPVWTLPESRIKTRAASATDFTIPLPPQAVDLLRELEVRACGSEWVLPARYTGRNRAGHASPGNIPAMIRRLDFGIPSFTAHDLRRTMRSNLSALGIPFAVAERCLNHRLPGMGEVYDRHDFYEQRAEALQRWADTLEVLEAEGVKAAKEFIGGAQVVELRRSA